MRALAVLAGLIILLMVFINLPFSKKLLTRQVNGLFSKLELPLHIKSIQAVRLKTVKLEGFSITDPGGDTIIYVEQLKADYHLLALTRNQVKLKNARISRVRVRLEMNEESGELTIAEAFTMDQKKKPADPAGKKNFWHISGRRIALSSVLFQMHDPLNGVHVQQEAGDLNLKKFVLSLEDKEIFAQSLELETLVGDILLSGTKSEQTQNKKSPWNYGAGNLALNDINFNYHHSRDSMLLELKLEKGTIKSRELNFPAKLIDVDQISLQGLHTGIFTARGSGDRQDSKTAIYNPFPWDIRSRKLDLEDLVFSKDVYAPRPGDSASYFGAEIREMKVREVLLSSSKTGMDLKKLSVHLSNGLNLTDMKAELDSDSTSTSLNLALETGNSRLSLDGNARRGFLDILRDPRGTPGADISIRNGRISLEDIATFIPALKEAPLYPMLAASPTVLALSANLEGEKRIRSDLSLSQDQKFRFSLQGSTEHSFNPEKANGKLELELNELNLPWLKELLIATGIESTIPDSTELSLLAVISDTLSSPQFDLQISSNKGSMQAAGFLDFNAKNYKISAGFEQFQLGEFLSVSQLGSFTGSAELDGSGFTPETLETDLSLRIDSLHFHNYDYVHTELEGSIRPGNYQVRVLAEDPNVHGILDAELLRVDSTFIGKTQGSLFARLDQLQLITDTLSVKGKISADFEWAIDYVESELHLEEFVINTPRDNAELSQLEAYFHADSVSTMLHTRSEFLDLELEVGKNMDELGSLGQNYRNYLQTFIDPEPPDSFDRVMILPEIKAAGYINYHEVLGIFISDPELYFSSIGMSMEHGRYDNSINYHLEGRDFENSFLRSEHLNLSLSDSSGILALSLIADSTSFFSGPSNSLKLHSDYKQRKSINILSIYDSLNSLTYELELASEVDSNRMLVKAPTRRLLLNRQVWNLDSTLVLGLDMDTKRISTELKMFTSDSSMIHLRGGDSNGTPAFRLDVNQMDITSFLPEGLIPGKPTGLLSGFLEYRHRDSSFRNINSDLILKEINFADLDFDELLVQGNFAFSDSGDYKLNLLAHLDSSRIKVNGTDTRFEPRNIQATFHRIPLNAVEPFIKKHVSDLQGTVSGDLGITSRGKSGHYNGHLSLEQARVRVNTLNSAYQIPDQRIQIKDEKVVFNQFRVLDYLNKALLVDGYLDLSDPENILTNVNISSSNLQVMNREASRDASLYGKIFVDSRIDVKGPLRNPSVDGRILLTQGTEIFYQKQEDLSLSESSRLINFVNHSEELMEVEESPFIRQGAFTNSSIKTLVEIDPHTEINFKVAQRIYGVELNIVGGGMLNYSMLNLNQVSLSGSYNIGQGDAELKLVGWPDKTFEIMDGGFVRWDGNLEDPELNFTAINRVASSYQNPLDGKQRNVDFNVILQISDHLSDMEIQLTFDTPDQYLMSIINTLSPEDQMRQAITILLFETVDLPGISTTSDYMAQQVNQILAAQLNQFTQSAIKGVDISFGLDTYTQSNSGGGQATTTSLSYEVSKSLLNNRAHIEFSGRLSDASEKPGASDMAYNNISFEYRLDSAATKYLKVYNEHSYEDVFEGEVIRTGVGITYRKRYKRIADIFRRKEKRNKAKKAVNE